MNLTRHSTPAGPRWAADGRWMPKNLTLAEMLAMPASSMQEDLRGAVTTDPAAGPVLAPLEDHQEVWASGVTYLRSRQAREAESATGDIYQRVYTAQRPELFFKAPGWRVIPAGGEVRVRADSRWNVPEPELTLVINSNGDIVGFTAGNDVSSRDIEGENPLYLPQAKVYTGSCALGPSIQLVDGPAEFRDLPIFLQITRSGTPVFQGETRTGMMKRNFEELASYLYRELDFPHGALLMTGTGIVPPEAFSLRAGDDVRVTVGGLVLQNRVKG